MTKHIDRETMRLLLEDGLTPKEKLAALEHTAACDACAELMATLTMESFAREPSEGFAESVLCRAREQRQKSAKREFTVYCLRVVAAVAAALVLLFSGAFTKLARLNYDAFGQKSAAVAQSVGKVFEKLGDISFNFNQTNHETEENSNEQ